MKTHTKITCSSHSPYPTMSREIFGHDMSKALCSQVQPVKKKIKKIKNNVVIRYRHECEPISPILITLSHDAI